MRYLSILRNYTHFPFYFVTQLQLWDTLGMEEYAQYTRSHFLLTQAVLFVYSVTDKDSFKQVLELLPLAKANAQGACYILVRNKIDLTPTFSEDEIPGAFVLQFSTSALNGTGTNEMLGKIATHLHLNATPMKSIHSPNRKSTRLHPSHVALWLMPCPS